MRFRKYFVITILILLLITVLTLFANKIVEDSAKSFLTDDVNKVSPIKTGLLLGTSKTLTSGKKNDFFYHRIDAAVELFNANKIEYIIVSGDNSRVGYNEPLDMKNELIKRGIPDSVIFLDYAGFRTLDSVIRAREIFGQNSFVVISQKFHNERAVYLAKRNGMNVFGFNARDVGTLEGLRTDIREYLARDKVFIDALFNVGPKYLGEKVPIE